MPGASGRLLGGVRKYSRIFRVSLIERMTYRGDFLLGTVLRFLPMITTILLWHAIYMGASPEGKPTETALAGFTFQQMVAYLLLVHISRMFSSMPGLASGIARDIRDGSLKKYLLQPLDMHAYLLSYRAAHKAAYIVTAIVPYAMLFFLFIYLMGLSAGGSDKGILHFPDLWMLLAYVSSLLLAFVIGFFFETCIGMIGFWMLEVTSLLWVVNTLNFFVSGHMFPLDLLGSPWQEILKALPFQYMAYFPAAIFLGKVPTDELPQALLIQATWAAIFIGLSRYLYRLGLRRYSAYGG